MNTFPPMPETEDDTAFFAKISAQGGVDDIPAHDIRDAISGLRRRVVDGKTIAQLTDKHWGVLNNHADMKERVARHLNRYRKEHVPLEVNAESLSAQGHEGLASVSSAFDGDGTHLVITAPKPAAG